MSKRNDHQKKPRLTRARLKDIWRRSTLKTRESDDGVLCTAFRYVKHARDFAALIKDIGGTVLGIETAGVYRYEECAKLPTSVRYLVPPTVADYILRRRRLEEVEGVEEEAEWSGVPAFRPLPVAHR